MNSNNIIPPIEELLPHRGTMLLLDRIVAFDMETGTAEYCPRAEFWYADKEGNMPTWIGMELMAQTVAAHVGLTTRREGTPPKEGVLLGTRAYRSNAPHFAAGEPLQIHTRLAYRDPAGLGAYDCSIARDGVTLATAVLKVFEPEDFNALIQENIS